MNFEIFDQTAIQIGAQGCGVYCWFLSLLQLTYLLIAVEIPGI